MSAPEQFEASIGNGLHGCYSVELVGDHVLWRFRDDSATATPTSEDWSRFRDVLNEVGVWHWADGYVDEGVVDGDYWAVRIAWGREVDSSGANAFPPRFRRFAAAVQELVGGHTFE